MLDVRTQGQASDTDSVSTISSSIEIGGGMTRITLSTETWPAMITVCGIVFVLIGLFFLLPNEPRQFYRNGLSQIGHFVQRVIESPKDGATVTITKTDGSNAVSMARKGKRVLLFIISDASMEARIKDYFTEHGINSSSDVFLTTRGPEDSLCHLEFPLGMDPKANTKLIRELFTTLLGVDDSMDLGFTTTEF